ncbi:MAG: TonB-dependent receptor plug domain-containing protein [Dysgonamonadaceae bacterium]|nr:TonB-dependent receptor plug domain-containing protein [Dysgonamonadaceae bacterium]
MFPVWLFAMPVCAQEQTDTLPVREIQEVVVSAAKDNTSITSSPMQIIDSKTLAGTGALSVGDAARQFAGVQVKDYGGVGGLKTVSLRSLGASHTGVLYDGIPVTDNQTGQIDLSRFSLTGIEKIILNTGESDNILQPAQIQSLAGSLNIITGSFMPDTGKKNHIKASLKGGAFGFFSPSIFYRQQISKTLSSGVSVDYLQSDGNYPYQQSVGTAGRDSIINRVRHNTAIKNLKMEANLNGKFGSGGRLFLKAYSFRTNRELPGPATYWNEFSDDRLKDRNLFIQMRYTHSITENTDYLVNAKFNFASSDYLNPPRRYLYFQREWYADAVVRRKFGRHFSASFANDLIYDSMNGNIISLQGETPERKTWFSALSAKYESERINITAKYTYAHASHINSVTFNTPLRKLSPYAGFSFKLLNTDILRLRGFFKNSFRLPTLTDFYYSSGGSPRPLKPENARQFNLGATFLSSLGSILPRVSLSADAYHNKVLDKIVAYPTADLNIWTILNIGKVDMRGIDLNSEIHINGIEKIPVNVGGSFSLQRVLDKTSQGESSYNKIPVYTPSQFGTGWTNIVMPWLEVNYTLLYSGRRYYWNSNRPESRMKPFSEQTVTLSKHFRLKSCSFTLSAECVNFTDEQYEIVRQYPMQGRSVRIELIIQFQ